MTQQQKPSPDSSDAQADKDTGSVKTPPAPTTNVLKTARERIEVPSPGLMLAGYHDKVIEDDYIAAMHAQLMTAGHKTGVPMPKVKHLHALYSGTRDVQRAKTLATMETLPEAAAPRTFHTFGSRSQFDFSSEEGSHALRTFIEQNPECAITAKASLAAYDPRLGERLLRIDIAAQDAQAYVMLFVDQSESAADVSLQHFAEECFEADTRFIECERFDHLRFSPCMLTRHCGYCGFMLDALDTLDTALSDGASTRPGCADAVGHPPCRTRATGAIMRFGCIHMNEEPCLHIKNSRPRWSLWLSKPKRHAQEFHAVVEDIRAKVAEYGITEKDIFGSKRGRPAKGAKPKAEGVAPRYRNQDPKTGATWSGRGRAPAWIKDAKNRDRFLIAE